MGNRSLVIHFYNGTRLACANWVAVANATNLTPISNMTIPNGTTGVPYPSLMTVTSSPTTSGTIVSPTKSGAATGHAVMLKNVIGLTPVLVALAAAVA